MNEVPGQLEIKGAIDLLAASQSPALSRGPRPLIVYRAVSLAVNDVGHWAVRSMRMGKGSHRIITELLDLGEDFDGVHASPEWILQHWCVELLSRTPSN